MIMSFLALVPLAIHNFIMGFVFYYPLIMAWMWIIGGTYFFIRREIPRPKLPVLLTQPGCSIIVPCYNEEDHVHDTIRYALATRYADFEVIAVNDGSNDRTGAILEELALHEPRLRVVHLARNQGKAIALRSGAISSRHEYLVCIDGDALLHPYCVHWMMSHLTSAPRIGAVTGNPRILTRSTLLGKIQVGEFSSIISLIKRAQRTYGRIFTVSGVIVGFRKTALHRVDYWNEEMITEDIDISWRLQMDHWDIRYEPEALCYIHMPETLMGLWKQRLRWAQGGIEVILRHTRELLSWKQRRFWMVAVEYMISVAWSYAMLSVLILYAVGLVVTLPPEWRVNTLYPEWCGLILGITCLIQFLISLWMDRRYERGRFLRNYVWIIWYPLLYWMLSMFTTIVAVPKTLLKKKGKRARWTSPDRGIKAIKPTSDMQGRP
jgi:biofilm PGA synthesis N-glycosyltransferase PgaC